jgi:hypothetical protein
MLIYRVDKDLPIDWGKYSYASSDNLITDYDISTNNNLVKTWAGLMAGYTHKLGVQTYYHKEGIDSNIVTKRFIHFLLLQNMLIL